MRTSAVLLLALAVAAIAFFAGRASVPDSAPPAAGPTRGPAPDPPLPLLSAHRPAAIDRSPSPDPRADLLRALQQGGPERNRAVRLAMHAWLAADGVAAIIATREDPELGELGGWMMQLALYAYPEVFLDDPSLFDGVPDAESLIASAAHVLAKFDPDVARALIETHLSDSPHGDAMLASFGATGPDRSPISLEDAYAEIESILTERNPQERNNRLHRLVQRLAAQDPAAAAELVDSLPRSSMMPPLGLLAHLWSESDPEAAARWLATKSPAESQMVLNLVARRWASRDFEAAGAFLETLTGLQRRGFLMGLADATQRMSNDEVLAWVARFEDDRSYSQLVMNVAGQLAVEDLDAALGLIESLPEEAQLAPYSSVLSQFALQDPEAAISILDGIESESARAGLVPSVATIWAMTDGQAALDWAIDLGGGEARNLAIAQAAISLAHIDPDRAVSAMEEIEEPIFRRSAVRNLIVSLDSEDEAVRLGRAYQFNRDDVLEIREKEAAARGWTLYPPNSRPYPAGTSIITSFNFETERVTD